MKKFAIVAAGLVLSSGLAFADEETNAMTFEQLDQDRNGYLTQPEAAMDKDVSENFIEADENEDGYISAAEYGKIKDKMKQQPKATS